MRLPIYAKVIQNIYDDLDYIRNSSDYETQALKITLNGGSEVTVIEELSAYHGNRADFFAMMNDEDGMLHFGNAYFDIEDIAKIYLDLETYDEARDRRRLE